MFSNQTSSQKSNFTMKENSEYMKEQNQEILLGKEEGLDVSLYSNPEFNWLQMEQIRMGIKDKVDVSFYADPSYSYETMKHHVSVVACSHGDKQRQKTDDHGERRHEDRTQTGCGSEHGRP